MKGKATDAVGEVEEGGAEVGELFGGEAAWAAIAVYAVHLVIKP